MYTSSPPSSGTPLLPRTLCIWPGFGLSAGPAFHLASPLGAPEDQLWKRPVYGLYTIYNLVVVFLILIIGLYYICIFTLIKYHDIHNSLYSDFPSTYNDSHMVCVCLCSGDKSCPTLWPHGLQHAKFLCPWDSPGKNTGVSCTMNKYRKGRKRLLKIKKKKLS